MASSTPRTEPHRLIPLPSAIVEVELTDRRELYGGQRSIGAPVAPCTITASADVPRFEYEGAVDPGWVCEVLEAAGRPYRLGVMDEASQCVGVETDARWVGLERLVGACSPRAARRDDARAGAETCQERALGTSWAADSGR